MTSTSAASVFPELVVDWPSTFSFTQSQSSPSKQTEFGFRRQESSQSLPMWGQSMTESFMRRAPELPSIGWENSLKSSLSRAVIDLSLRS
jgi:hypothetical protein